MKAARPGQFMFITRQQAARLLRAARDHHADNQGERIGWALAALKDSRHAQRLKIDYLLRVGNFDSADAMLARHLLTGREHPLMRLRFARSMFLQGRLDSAQLEIARVMDERPDHHGARLLGASIAAARGEHDRAVELLVTAADRRPTCRRLRARLIEALLDADLIKHAQRELERLPDAPASLRARVLRAAGRTVDARDALQPSADGRLNADLPSEAVVALIEIAEATGDFHQLTQISQWLHDSDQADQSKWDVPRDGVSKACLRAGIEFVSLDDMESAIAESSRVRQARTPWCEPAGLDSPPDDSSWDDSHQAEIARLWLGRLLGQLLAEQADAGASGSDPSPNLLPPLLEQATAAINRHLAAGTATEDRRFKALREHRDIIQHTLGRS